MFGLPAKLGAVMQTEIDIAFDFRSDSRGKDPDTYSPTLRSYHKLLWSKTLPGGADFALDASGRNYLYHRSDLGEFWLSSDAVVPSFSRNPRMSHIISQIPRGDVDSFNSLGYTIGGMMVFPGNRIGTKMTINQARGCYGSIKDRFDFTVECIRRHYCDESSPLGEVLERYADFFGLFGDFRGYVEHFLLQDLVEDDFSAVRFSTPFEDFHATSPLPGSVEAYTAYRQRAMDFIAARNRRILQFCGL